MYTFSTTEKDGSTRFDIYDPEGGFVKSVDTQSEAENLTSRLNK